MRRKRRSPEQITFVGTRSVTIAATNQRAYVEMGLPDMGVNNIRSIEDRMCKLSKVNATFTSEHGNPGATASISLLPSRKSGWPDYDHGRVDSRQITIAPMGVSSVSVRPRISKDWNRTIFLDDFLGITILTATPAPSGNYTFMIKLTVSILLGRVDLAEEPVSSISMLSIMAGDADKNQSSRRRAYDGPTSVVSRKPLVCVS